MDKASRQVRLIDATTLLSLYFTSREMAYDGLQVCEARKGLGERKRTAYQMLGEGAIIYLTPDSFSHILL